MKNAQKIYFFNYLSSGKKKQLMILVEILIHKSWKYEQFEQFPYEFSLLSHWSKLGFLEYLILDSKTDTSEGSFFTIFYNIMDCNLTFGINKSLSPFCFFGVINPSAIMLNLVKAKAFWACYCKKSIHWRTKRVIHRRQ